MAVSPRYRQGERASGPLAAFLVQLLFGAWLVLFLLCALVTLMLAGIAASSALAVNRRG